MLNAKKYSPENSQIALKNISDIRIIKKKYLQAQRDLSIKIQEESASEIRSKSISFDKDKLMFTFFSVFRRNEVILEGQKRRFFESFYPRLLNLLTSQEFKYMIKNVTISGHTDKTYSSKLSVDGGYIQNMNISQARAKHILEIFLDSRNSVSDEDHLWFRKNAFALGQSWNRLLKTSKRSRRIDLRIVTDNKELSKVLGRL